MSYSGPSPSGMDDKNNLHNAFQGAQLPPPVAPTPQPITKSSRSLTAILVVIAIALVVVGVLLGIQVLKSSTSESVPVAAPETVTKKVEVVTEVVTKTTVATQQQQPQEPASNTQAASQVGLKATGFSALSCVGNDTWVFAAVSTDGKHVLICQFGTTGGYYYTHDYLADVYRKDVDEANLAAGTFRVVNSDATISIAPSGLFVDAVQGSDFSSSFSTSFTSNPWR